MDSLAAQDVKTRAEIDEENYNDADQDEKIRFKGKLLKVSAGQCSGDGRWLSTNHAVPEIR